MGGGSVLKSKDFVVIRHDLFSPVKDSGESNWWLRIKVGFDKINHEQAWRQRLAT